MNNDNSQKRKSFWISIPGILISIAVLIAAIAGLIAAIGTLPRPNIFFPATEIAPSATPLSFTVTAITPSRPLTDTPSPTLTFATTVTPRVVIGNGILVDSSRDGGLWWFPQAGPFNACEPHQGMALADYLRTRGFSVTELPRTTTITFDFLASFGIVIRANEYETYSPSEIKAYHDYLKAGGKLLLLSDYMRPNEQDSLAESFGITFQGITQGDNVLDSFIVHPITIGVLPLKYNVGSGITRFPTTATILGYLSIGSYLDLNDNKVRDPNELTNIPVLGAMMFENGKIVFSGDGNMWLDVPQPLVDNTLDWLLE